MIEIKAKIWSIKDGEISQIKIDDEVYEISSIKKIDYPAQIVKEKIKEYKEKVKEPEPEPEPVGKAVGKYDTIKIYSNVRDAVKEAMDEGLSRPEIGHIIQDRFSPKSKYESCCASASVYMRFINGLKPGKKQIPDRGEKVGNYLSNSIYSNPLEEIKKASREGKSWKWMRDNITSKYYPNYKKTSINSTTNFYKRFMEEGETTKQYKQRVQRVTPKPENYVGRSDTYRVNITKDDIIAIKRALHHYEYGYKPSCENIIRQTKLARNRVLGTIDLLKNEKKVIPVYTENGELIYVWNDKNETQQKV